MKRLTAKEILAESFRELAQKMPIDRITVRDITANCGYSQATFYRQYRDKYDLIAWSYTRDLEAILFMKEHHILPMSYSSLGSGYHPHPDIHQNRPVMKLCGAAGISPEAMMLRWNVRHGFRALFSTSSAGHLRENLRTVPDDVYTRFERIIEDEFPVSEHPYPLVKI